MRKIAVVTGSRAEYGILYPVLKAIQAKQGLELLLIVTGMHLSHEFGYTVRDIEQAGFEIVTKVDMLISGDTPGAMAKSVGVGIIGLTQAWEQLKPDIILVLGDRIEPLAAAISGAYMNIPIAHIHGGDAGIGCDIDDPNRFAITKFAHIHFPATKRSAERIIKMGENEWRVNNVGSPALDVILHTPIPPRQETARRFGLDLAKPIILAVQHPVTTQVAEASHQMKETMDAIVESGYQAVLIYPNADSGARSIIEVIKEYEKYPFIKTFQNLPRLDYLSLMKLASVMVSNSSSGLIEAPSFGLPVVNVGIRQFDRERGKNIIDVGHNKMEILAAIAKALKDEDFINESRKCENPYGDGKASQRIVDLLESLEITPVLLQKKITY